MIQLQQSGPSGGDCTAPYSIVVDKSYTVGEFIDEIVKNRTDEWGTFYIGSIKSRGYYDPSAKEVEYKYGSIVKSDPSVKMDMKIITVDARGGWTLMSYWIYI